MNECILDMQHVNVDRKTRKKVLNIDNFQMKHGELVAVVGPNGAGKSTLLQVINLLHSYQGKIQLFGKDSNKVDKTTLRRQCAMVFQDALLLNDTVFNNVALPLKFRGMATSEIRQSVYQALADFRCDHLAHRPARSLSGGEAQRVSIARALVTLPTLLLLDEPFASLDKATREEMIGEIRQLVERKGISVLLVSHDFTDVLQFAERVIVMFAGSIVQDNKPEVILRKPINQQVAKLVGMDNIIPCHIEMNDQNRLIKLTNGTCFALYGDGKDSVTACCLPGDSLYLCEGNFPGQQEQWIELEGVVERIIPGLGAYQVIVKIGKDNVTARLPRSHITSNLHIHDKIKLTFDPAEVHLI
jgi:tungstate transport system ATP-binding protein